MELEEFNFWNLDAYRVCYLKGHISYNYKIYIFDVYYGLRKSSVFGMTKENVRGFIRSRVICTNVWKESQQNQLFIF